MMIPFDPVTSKILFVVFIVLVLAFIWHAANMHTRKEMVENIRSRKVDKRDVYVTPVALTREQVKVWWPDCPVSFFVWRADKVRGLGWRLCFSYQIGTTTTVTHDLLIRYADIADDDTGVVNHCRKLMMKAMSA